MSKAIPQEETRASELPCDDKKQHHTHHHRPHSHRYEDERTQVTINVNVGCCKPSSGTGCDGGTKGTGTSPGRPTHQTGKSDGSINAGATSGGILKIPGRPADVWPGQRKDLLLPYLFIRAVEKDTGTRPIVGEFWESPDIFILPGVAPEDAPNEPPKNLGDVAKSGADNTVYAHVWNLGYAPAYGVLVEFFWFNPTLGFDTKGAHLIGRTYVDLNHRCGAGSHKLVKCPFSWRARYENGGHECLVVRISQSCTDPLSGPAWDASQNRHIGQRNIHVMTAAEAAAKPTLGINIGPLFGLPGQVAVTRTDPKTMPWLKLVTMSRTKLPGAAAASGDVGITPPRASGAGLPNLGAVPDPRAALLIGDSQGVNGEDQQIGFVATDSNPGDGNAHVYRVSGTQNGAPFGGYTVVVLGH